MSWWVTRWVLYPGLLITFWKHLHLKPLADQLCAPAHSFVDLRRAWSLTNLCYLALGAGKEKLDFFFFLFFFLWTGAQEVGAPAWKAEAGLLPVSVLSLKVC